MPELETLVDIQLKNPTDTIAQITMRDIRTIDEFRQCEELQARIWGPDDIVGVPTLVLLTAQENGGIVIGAFLDDTQLIGFVCSFPGVTPSRSLKQCSLVMGVDPAYQAYGLGHHLKQSQRATALAQGIDYITWTFDPLISTNAYLNLNKLGAVSSTYLINVYGEGHGLNAGLETDRLLTDWWLTDCNVADRASHGIGSADTRCINEVELHSRLGLPLNRRFHLDLSDELLHMEIPANIHELKRRDLALARAWRMDVREIFCSYFARGYQVCGFSRGDWGLGPYYVLRRGAST